MRHPHKILISLSMAVLLMLGSCRTHSELNMTGVDNTYASKFLANSFSSKKGSSNNVRFVDNSYYYDGNERQVMKAIKEENKKYNREMVFYVKNKDEEITIYGCVNPRKQKINNAVVIVRNNRPYEFSMVKLKGNVKAEELKHYARR